MDLGIPHHLALSLNYVIVHACTVGQLRMTLQSHELQPARLLHPWNSLGKNTRVGCHFFLQGIFLTQGSKLHLWYLMHWPADSLPLSHLGSPYVMTLLFLILYLTAYYFYLNLSVSSLCKWLPFLNERVIVTQLCPTIYDPMGLLSARFLCPWNSPGKNTGVGCHFLLQGCFPKWFDNSKLPWNLKKRASSQDRQVSISRAPVRTPCFLNFTLCGCDVEQNDEKLFTN